jgi:hypothetical protein
MMKRVLTQNLRKIQLNKLTLKKDDLKLNVLKEDIKSVEKEIKEKSSALEEILGTAGSLVLADREKTKMEEEKRKMVEQTETLFWRKEKLRLKELKRLLSLRKTETIFGGRDWN